GIFSAVIFSVLWVNLFHGMRLLTDVPSILFLFASIYFFIRANKHELNYRLFTISLFLLSISTLIRFINGIVFFIYLIMLLLSKNFDLNKRKFWVSGLTGILPVLIFFAYNFMKYQNIFPAFFGSDYLSPEETSALPFAWNLLNYVPLYLKTLFLIFFILGGALIIFEILMGYNLVKKNIKIRNYFFIVFLLVVVYSFFIFYMRIGDDRWLLIISLPLCLITGLGIDYLRGILEKYNKYLSLLVVLLVLLAGVYSQVTYSNDLIQNKKTSFLQIRQGFEWLKENTPPESVIIGNGIQPYTVYYAERQYLDFPANSSGKSIISNADYLVMHAFTPQSQYLQEYLQENQGKWKPIIVFFFDQEKTQPALVIYQRV
ncbi:MAG: hypothetical protein Q8Q04_01375, partial [archaeon]|nr:hypothetical protein [archaeon]